jgi:hypothetical protein
MFFFEKKNQKTFSLGSERLGAPNQRSKSFLLLFFKKEDLPYAAADRPLGPVSCHPRHGTGPTGAVIRG